MKRTVLDYTLKVRVPLVLFVVAISFIVTFYVSRQERDGVGYHPTQPIQYSHKLHAGDMGIDCQYCHVGVTKERHALIPSVNICMNCHTIARRDKPEIIKLTTYYKTGKPLKWNRVHKVPEFAYFDHSVHVNKGIDCVTCHGNVREMTTVMQMKSFTMTACLDCHRYPEKYAPYVKDLKPGPRYCAACHR
ncbi:MAG: cytochrome c3 family protein [Chlorobi bacterium]|nr:cytochrome c3 family protein [Chlorobiota bacterium]